MFFANRGMYLESLINYTIEKLKQERKALIFKIFPYLIKNKNSYHHIKAATVDYHGVYQGKYLCFEAKTTNQQFLPWNNIVKHQWQYLVTAYELQAISFMIIYFTSYNEYYLVFIQHLIILKQNNHKITRMWLKKNGHQLEIVYPFILNFINLI